MGEGIRPVRVATVLGDEDVRPEGLEHGGDDQFKTLEPALRASIGKQGDVDLGAPGRDRRRVSSMPPVPGKRDSPLSWIEIVSTMGSS